MGCFINHTEKDRMGVLQTVKAGIRKFLSLLLWLVGFNLCGCKMSHEETDEDIAETTTLSCPSCLTVHVSEVDSRNATSMLPVMENAIRRAAFVSVDVEFSGLGDRRLLGANIVDERYEAMSDIADSRSILALGISTFKLKKHCRCDRAATDDDTPTSDSSCSHAVQYSSRTFNLVVHSRDAYMIDPDAALFLTQHGYDFNRLFRHGLKFTKKCVMDEGDDASDEGVHKLFKCLLQVKVPLILHNGLLDLCFLYRNFYGPLPTKLPTFLADLSEMFPSGVFDTKFISMFHTQYHLTQLEYTFKKCLQDNYVRFKSGKPCSCVTSKGASTAAGVIVCCPLRHTDDEKKLNHLCQHFLKNGHCSNTSCEKLHSVDLIMAKERLNRTLKKAKKRKSNGNISMAVTGVELLNIECTTQRNDSDANSGCHQAGYDAFMTGYIFAVFLSQFERDVVLHKDSQYRNRLPLSRKDIPLQILKSHFSTTSVVHNKQSIVEL